MKRMPSAWPAWPLPPGDPRPLPDPLRPLPLPLPSPRPLCMPPSAGAAGTGAGWKLTCRPLRSCAGLSGAAGPAAAPLLAPVGAAAGTPPAAARGACCSHHASPQAQKIGHLHVGQQVMRRPPQQNILTFPRVLCTENMAHVHSHIRGVHCNFEH